MKSRMQKQLIINSPAVNVYTHDLDECTVRERETVHSVTKHEQKEIAVLF
mgnify:CR=1 FL=1